MNRIYQPQEIETKIQQDWENSQAFVAKEIPGKQKFYCLSMLPYPSGQIHMGHARNYTISDVIARYQRMLGKNVMQPLGWDAFGLPAENAALQNKLAPSEWTYKNIAQMRTTIKQLGFAIDWTRELATCRPDYYKFEQQLFLKMYQKGLAYKKKSIVNWDPVDQTVLANEQVVDGRGWRSGALVERREISQWFLKITAYADELLSCLDNLTGWPEQVRTMQRNWIGRSEGLELDFNVVGRDDKIRVFTTRPDTVFGVTFLSIAAEHPIAQEAAKTNSKIADFLQKCHNIKAAEAEVATIAKEGFYTGFDAINPLSGEVIPIWVANFVLMEYGTGAVMAVPAHDERDHEFAKQYSLKIKQVIKPIDSSIVIDIEKSAFTEKGILFNSQEFSDLNFSQAFTAIADRVSKSGQGEKKINYRLRDWGVSRQRYWGAPIPIINCQCCGAVAVPEQDLPVVLPEGVKLTDPRSPLHTLDSFLTVKCPKCGGDATRETDTFDTFMESSWYYARYCCPDQNDKMFDERVDYWMGVDQYVGGIEHAIMHLLYARFIYKVMRDEGLVKGSEPFINLLTQGMVLKGGTKMSKSKGNIVAPGELIAKYGVDTVRLFMMFAAPPEQSLEWSDSGVEGAHRFLKKLFNFTMLSEALIINNKNTDKPEEFTKQQQKWRHEIHSLLKQASFDMQRLQFNTVVSAAMKLLNLLQEIPVYTNEFIIYEGFRILLEMLNPITPHLVGYLWDQLKFVGNSLDAQWPMIDQEALKQDFLDVVVQVNGKVRGKVGIPANTDEVTIKNLVLANDNISKSIGGAEIKKIIIVPNKLVSIVC